MSFIEKLPIINRFTGPSQEELAKEAGMTLSEWKAATKLGGIDIGWIIMDIGMAIGAGIVFLPVQVGLSGLWIYILAALIGYPIMYQHQKLFLNILADAPKCEDFAGIISGYLGKNWGFALGAIYFIFTTILIFLYSTALTNDSASFLVTFGVTETSMADNIFYGLGIICVLVAVASQGEKLLFKVASGMVLTKVFVIAAMGILMVQYWNAANIAPVHNIGYIIKQFIIILPFAALSIEFFANLSPTVIYYRNHAENKTVAHYKALRTYNYAYIILLVVVIFYTVSFNLAISQEQAIQAYHANISSLAMAAKDIDGSLVKVFSLLLNIFAIVTAYFAMFLSFRDSCCGIAVNILERIIPTDKINRTIIKYGTSIFCIVLCWAVIVFNAPVLSFASLLSPMIGIIACFLPLCLVYKLDVFKKYRTFQVVPIALLGFFLLISPFISLS